MQGKRIIDIHCHLLNGVDDGPGSLEEAQDAILEYKEKGIRALILTPHFRRDMFEASQEEVQSAYYKLMTWAREEGMLLYPGCEYHVNSDMIEDLQEKRRWTLANSRYVLTEFSSHHTASEFRNYIGELVRCGYIPIVAHVERYQAVRSDWDLLYDLVQMGAGLQVNADAVLGMNGAAIRQYVRRLLEEELVSFVASDCHGIAYRPSHLMESYEYIIKNYGIQYAEELFWENPRKILLG